MALMPKSSWAMPFSRQRAVGRHGNVLGRFGQHDRRDQIIEHVDAVGVAVGVAFPALRGEDDAIRCRERSSENLQRNAFGSSSSRSPGNLLQRVRQLQLQPAFANRLIGANQQRDFRAAMTAQLREHGVLIWEDAQFHPPACDRADNGKSPRTASPRAASACLTW